MLYVLVALAVLAVHGAPDNVDLAPEYLEKEQLDFVSRAITEVFARGSFPTVFEATAERISSCGCSYMPSRIKWGSRVGLQCKMDQEGFKRECGQSCMSPFGDKVLLMCPTGWKANCVQGCVLPKFDPKTNRRAKFLQGQVQKVIETGYDFAEFDGTMTQENCGCNAEIKHIKYGTAIGFDCVQTGEMKEGAWCAGFGGCLNDAKENILIFCPDGYESTCNGCTKTVNEDAASWMVEAMTGFIRMSKNALDLQPRPSQVVDCGCVDDFKPISGYGSRIGFSCNVGAEPDRAKINAKGECGNNIMCINADKENVVHVCPPGFNPNCETGCGYSWGNKQEL